MNMHYRSSQKIKNKLLRELRKGKKKEKYLLYIGMILSGLAILFAIISFFYSIWILLLTIVLVIIAERVLMRYMEKSAFPYSIESRETIKLFDDGLEFSYIDKSDIKDRPLNMTVYRIAKEDISAVRYSSGRHIITIIGVGELIHYDNYVQKRVNNARSYRPMYANTPYEILMCFENEYDIVCQIMDLAPRKFFDD